MNINYQYNTFIIGLLNYISDSTLPVLGELQKILNPRSNRLDCFKSSCNS